MGLHGFIGYTKPIIHSISTLKSRLNDFLSENTAECPLLGNNSAAVKRSLKKKKKKKKNIRLNFYQQIKNASADKSFIKR